MRTSAIPVTALVLALAAADLPAAAAESGMGWFVLRDRTSGDCWTGRLISINGQYATGKDQIAGGPFASEEEAEAHRETLVERSTCTQD